MENEEEKQIVDVDVEDTVAVYKNKGKGAYLVLDVELEIDYDGNLGSDFREFKVVLDRVRSLNESAILDSALHTDSDDLEEL